MITDLLLATTLGLGQMPAPTSPMPVAQYPGREGNIVLVMQPGGAAPVPMATTPMGSPMDPMGTEEKKNGDADKAKEDESPEAPAPKKYFIMSTLEGSWFGNALDNSGFAIYGWTEGSYTASSTRYSNLPVTTNDWANEFLMNQNYLVIEKTIDTSKSEVQWGFRMDTIVPGSDYRFTLPRGLWNNQLTSNNGSPELYGFDIYQQFVDLYVPDIGEGTTFRGGRFGTFIEYEVVQAVDTPFVSRNYSFQYNAFTHSGGVAYTKLNDTWSVANGLVLGADNYFGSNTARLNYIGQVKWAPPEGKTSVLFNTMITNPKYEVEEAFTQYNVYNLQVITKVSDSLTHVFDTIFSHTYNVPDIGTAVWYGFTNYLIKKHNDCVSSTFRLEFFDDHDGFRTGFKGLYTDVTYGLAWTPTDALIVRPGVRYDNNSQSSPFEGSNSLFTAWIDMIWRW